MGIGISVLLLALGAVLAFASDLTVQGFDISLMGWFLMSAGVVGMTLVLLVWGPRDEALTGVRTITR